MALCETQSTCKTWESGGMSPRKRLQNMCSEIGFCANFDLLADKLNILKEFRGLTKFTTNIASINTSILSEISITEHGVFTLLSQIDPHKACGLIIFQLRCCKNWHKIWLQWSLIFSNSLWILVNYHRSGKLLMLHRYLRKTKDLIHPITSLSLQPQFCVKHLNIF